MPLTNWRKVVKMAAGSFACYLMEHNDKSQQLTLEAMLGCRNPNDEPKDRIYIGWHIQLSMTGDKLQLDEKLQGSCVELGSWKNDLTKKEQKDIDKHLAETLKDFRKALDKLGLELPEPQAEVTE